MNLLIFVIATLFGLVAIKFAAELFVNNACKIAKYFNVPNLIIGMVIMGFGTSCPELLVSATASLNNSGELALGNVMGSNIANIGLILGLTAALAPITIKSEIIFKDIPFLFVLSIATCCCLIFNYLNKISGLSMLAIFVVYLLYAIKRATKSSTDELVTEQNEEVSNNKSTYSIIKTAALCLLGLIALIISSDLIVYGASGIAKAFGISEATIGATIVALGTSLPELAGSLTAVKQGKCDLALGNVIGSNLFNTLVVLGTACTINDITPDHFIAVRDGVCLTLMTLLLFFVSFNWLHFKHNGIIKRYEGIILLSAYIGYNILLSISL